MHLCTLTRLQHERIHTFYGLCFQGSDNIAISKSEFGNITRNPRKCRESCAKASRKLRYLNQAPHVATGHSSSPHVTSQRSRLLHLTPQATSWHQNRSHHHHGTAEGWFTAKKWLGHRAGRSPCAHSIGKFFLLQIVKISSSNGTVRRESSRKRFL